MMTEWKHSLRIPEQYNMSQNNLVLFLYVGQMKMYFMLIYMSKWINMFKAGASSYWYKPMGDAETEKQNT